MKTQIVLIAALSLMACDEAVPGQNDTGSTDVSEDTTADVAVDVAEDLQDADPDAEPDAEPDVEPDVEIDAEPDVEPDAVVDAEPDVEFDAEPDADVEPEVVEDTGLDCGDDPDICEAPYVCIDGACQIDVSESTWSESDFDITEPEELTRIFEIFKSFATNVKFMVIDFGELSGSVGALYGVADIIDETVSPVEVSWQALAEPGEISFVPARDDDSPLEGDSWISGVFLYELRAAATIEFPGFDEISANFGLDAEQVTLQMWFNPLDLDRGTARLTGIVTREEAENRDLASRDEFDGFDALFCETAGYDPGLDWQLADILDCNGAIMDADVDDDGTLDGYRVVIDAEFSPAILLPAALP